MTATVDVGAALAELEWLKKNPAFEQRPATLEEFLGPGYLNIQKYVRAAILRELREIFGDEVSGRRIARYQVAMFTGGIGIGKTTIASIILAYMVHWVLCLHDPQDFFNLMPGSKIAFMMMSTSEDQARNVMFNDIKGRLDNSEWFIEKAPYDPKFTKTLRFPKNIWIIPGDSAETTFEGYNILGGILEEMDSHKATEDKDYADVGYDTISNRISSRFGDRGLLVCIGQMKKTTGFAARKWAELKMRDDAHVVRMAIWDSFGDDYYRCYRDGPHEYAPDNPVGTECGQVHKFAYDTKRKEIVPTDAAMLLSDPEHILWVPVLYIHDFKTNPEKALKDLAGLPPIVGSAFISLTYKVEDARNRYLQHYHEVDGTKLSLRECEQYSPVDLAGRFAKWFTAKESIKRAAHLDIGYSDEGDALAISMGHVSGIVEIEGEMKPYIVIDCIVRMKAPAGGEVFLSSARHALYALRDDFNFKLKRVTMDGFQSTDTNQQLRKRRFETAYESIDKQLAPYYDLRDAIYEDRIEFPAYVVYLNPGSTEVVEIAVKELTELVDNGDKVDHPLGGSKDVADTLAGVVFTLMGDKTYRRKVTSLDSHRQQREQRQQAAVGMGGVSHPAYVGDRGFKAPLPPTSWRS